MSELYRFMKTKIRPHLEGLRPAQLEQLEAAFNEIDGGAAFEQVKNNKPKETIVTNIDPQGIKGGQKKKPVAKAKPVQ